MALRIGLLGMVDNVATPLLLSDLDRLGHLPRVVFLLKPDLRTHRRRLMRKLRGAGLAATVSRVADALTGPVLARSVPVRQSEVPAAYDVHIVRDFNALPCRQLIQEARLDLLLLSTDTMLKRETFTLPRIGCLNAHPGWLPAYRGLGSMSAMIRDGLAPAISVHFIDEGVDTGPTLIRESIDQLAARGGDKAERFLISESARMFAAAIERIERGDSDSIDTFLEPSNMTRGTPAKEARALQAQVAERAHRLIRMEDQMTWKSGNTFPSRRPK